MLKQFGLAALGLSGLTGLVNAADLAPLPDQSDWVFTAAPYLSTAGISGDVAAFGAPEIDIDVSAIDVLKHFDIGFMGAAEARNGRFSIGGNLVWAKISGDKSTPLGILVDKVELTAETLMVTGVGDYSLVYGEGRNLDVIAGGRLWPVDNTLKLKGGIGPLSGLTFDDGETWVDPVVGFKGRADIGSVFWVTGGPLSVVSECLPTSCGTSWAGSDMNSTILPR